jgi:hypothetical protein
MGFNWGSFFASGVEELGEVAKAKDVSVAAEAKAQAEEFAEKQEAYEDEVTKNKRLLRQEADSIRGLGIKDIGKIRTVMNTYGNADVMNKIKEDFKTYQSKSLIEGKKPQFNTLEGYIKGRITGAGTAMISDEAAEQASDEAAIIGNELDIQKAEKKAKAQGISLDEYLQNQAIKMSDRPAFNLDARAARLVEESKMGIFGKTLTLEEAKKQILGGKTMEGAGIAGEVKDLGETGFALSREGGLSAEERIKLKALQDRVDPKLDPSALLTLENKYINQLGDKFTILKEGADGVSRLTISDAPEAKAQMLKVINNEIDSETFKKLSPLGQKQLLALKEKYERSSAKKEEKTSKVNIQKRDEKIKSYKKQGMSNQDIANGLVQSAKNKGQELSMEEALKIVQGIQ